MRYPLEHKSRVRERIVQAAARRFRAGGSASVAIADLMHDLGLTHGGFYRHFEGKEHLFCEALIAAAEQTRARMQAAADEAPGRELEAIITAYLSAEHCANPRQGCPIAALAAELVRHPKSTRAKVDREILRNAAAVARYLPGASLAEREQNAVVLFAGMAGTLALARATADPTLRQSILESARNFYLRLVRRTA